MELGMLVLPEIKFSRHILVSHLDLWAGTASRRTTSKEVKLNIKTWSLRTLQLAGGIENLSLKMNKCKLSVVGLIEVQWPKKGKMVLGNYTMFYSGGVKAGNSVTVVL